ncbi:MAG: hypothetical protein AB7O43_01430 [Hyphomicrobiaceae bacterium]
MFLSLLALLVSGFSLYESTLRSPQIAVYVPPQLTYTDPDRPETPFEVFVLPVTIANSGAQSGTVLAVNLEVVNPRTKQSKLFYAARLGTWGDKPERAFAPVALAGKTSYSESIQFFPRVGEKVARILDFEGGDYRFKLMLDTAGAGRTVWLLSQPAAVLEFERRIGKLDYRNFQGTGTMEMWAADYRSSSSQP